jgi:hypothetical protein
MWMGGVLTGSFPCRIGAERHAATDTGHQVGEGEGKGCTGKRKQPHADLKKHQRKKKAPRKYTRAELK